MIQSFLGFLGRALIGGVFVFASIHIILNWQHSEQLIAQNLSAWQPLAAHVDSMIQESVQPSTPTTPSLPATPPAVELKKGQVQPLIDWCVAHTSLITLLAVLFGLIGGLFVLLGLFVRLGAFLLLCLLVPATILLHPFWDMQDPQRHVEMVDFIKNLAIIGGLLFIFARGLSDSYCGAESKDVAE